MNKRISISIFISVLLILVLTACAGADEVKLTPSDGAAGDWFGYSVSTSGDYVIVGARCDDDRGDYSGSAYIFKRDVTTWSQQAKITASDGAAGDRFGHSVAISGDYVIVGALGADDSSASSGSVYIFKRDGTTWGQQAKITASDGVAGDRFGYSVAISGGYVIVGAHCDDDRGDYSGSAYIYKRDGTTWSQQAKITASDGAACDHFSFSVSISGDCVIMSAPWDDDTGIDSGSAYIFKRDGTTWSQQTKITAIDDATDDRFGCSTSVSGNCVIVGANCDDDRGDYSGSAYIYKHDGTTWSQQTKITASDGVTGDLFGQSVAISGDYVIVGAYCDDDDGENSGSAYIYDIQTTEPPITGDLNDDGRLTPTDAVIALKMAAGSCEPTTAADVSSDGVVNSLDALIILQAAGGLITL